MRMREGIAEEATETAAKACGNCCRWFDSNSRYNLRGSIEGDASLKRSARKLEPTRLTLGNGQVEIGALVPFSGCELIAQSSDLNSSVQMMLGSAQMNCEVAGKSQRR